MEVIRLDKPNFNQLKSVKTPESWVEKALKIPSEQKKPLPLFFRPAIIGTAAGVAFAAVLGVLLFMTLGRNNIPVQPSTQSTAVPQDSTAPTFTTPQGEIYVTTPQGATQPVTTQRGQPATVSPSGAVQPAAEPAETSGGNAVRPQLPTVSPSQPATTTPTVKPTQAPTVKPTQAPTVRPTEAPTIRPDEPVTPATEAPEEPVTEEPWYPWIPPDDPPEPKDPEYNDPPGAGGESSCRIYFVNNGYFPEGTQIYCEIPDHFASEYSTSMPMTYLGNGTYVVDTGNFGVQAYGMWRIWFYDENYEHFYEANLSSGCYSDTLYINY